MPEWKIGDRIENRYEIYQILRGGMPTLSLGRLSGRLKTIYDLLNLLHPNMLST